MIVGDPGQVVAELRAYMASGSTRSSSGYPHLAECGLAATYVLAKL